MVAQVRDKFTQQPAAELTLGTAVDAVDAVSAAALAAESPLTPARRHQILSEAARLLQASLVGARDAAIHANAPRGIRLLPDPAFFTVTTLTDSNGNPTPLLDNQAGILLRFSTVFYF